MNSSDTNQMFDELGAKPSPSEEHGLALVPADAKLIFSPGISTAGFAEIRMVRQNPERKVIATTIDEEGLAFAKKVIAEVGLEKNIEAKLEDLRGKWNYPADYFDFIYARLVLHYLSLQDLEKTLKNFAKSLKSAGNLFVVVRSVKNIESKYKEVSFDPITHFTTTPRYAPDGSLKSAEQRYFHTPESITGHLKDAGFTVEKIEEYEEQLYRDFMRKDMSPKKDHVIEILARKA